MRYLLALALAAAGLLTAWACAPLSGGTILASMLVLAAGAVAAPAVRKDAKP